MLVAQAILYLLNPVPCQTKNNFSLFILYYVYTSMCNICCFWFFYYTFKLTVMVLLFTFQTSIYLRNPVCCGDRCMAVIYSISLVHSEFMTVTGCMVVIYSISLVHSEFMTDTECMVVIYSISLVHSEFMTDTGCMVVIYSISFVYSEFITYRSPYKDDVIQYSQYI